MTCLADFHDLTLDELTAEIRAMLETLFTPATAGRSSRDAAGDSNPLDRAVAGSYQESA